MPVDKKLVVAYKPRPVSRPLNAHALHAMKMRKNDCPIKCRYCDLWLNGPWQSRRHKGIGSEGPTGMHIKMQKIALDKLFAIVRENGF